MRTLSMSNFTVSVNMVTIYAVSEMQGKYNIQDS